MFVMASDKTDAHASSPFECTNRIYGNRPKKLPRARHMTSSNTAISRDRFAPRSAKLGTSPIQFVIANLVESPGKEKQPLPGQAGRSKEFKFHRFCPLYRMPTDDSTDDVTSCMRADEAVVRQRVIKQHVRRRYANSQFRSLTKLRLGPDG